ncbi:MAG TPA: TnsD family transposase [Oculatellaceae cyanobacterium]|jgi:hypothetical protein
MIGFFSDPYPDELLYSICARYSNLTQYPDKKLIVKELFGTNTALAVVNLPSHLNSLIAALPIGHSYSVEQLIDNHTLLPFYSPFHPSERMQRLRKDMGKTSKVLVSARLGLMANSIPSPKCLRFCPVCVDEDKNLFGECYWHRIHQVPGVEVCPIHSVFLENSNAQILHRKTRHEFVSAEQAIYLTLPRFLELSNPCHRILLKIAQDTAWLLNQRELAPGIDSFRCRYLRLLAERDLATYSGRVNVSRLLDAFNYYYSASTLKLLHCEIDRKSEHNWLFRLVRSPKSAQHPLHHLLLIQFLDHTTETFFKLTGEFKPFGNPPWPCLNPVCDRFRKKSIKQYRLSYSKENGNPIGTFSCSCGFAYSRIGSDRSSEDSYRYSKVECYGLVWESALRELWADTKFSLRAIARLLEVDPRTVKLHANRLQLNFPRPTSRPTYHPVNPPLNTKTFPAQKNDLNNNRMAWLTLKQENPQAGGKELRSQLPRVYMWLYKNDRIWLKANMPPRKKALIPPRVDWDSRDREWSEAAKLSAERLKNSAGKPIQITVAAIARDIGQLDNIQKHLNKLPLTAKVLSEVVETREQFAVRRINRAREYFQQENIYPQEWQLIRRANLRPELLIVPQVKEAIASALEPLNPLS